MSHPRLGFLATLRDAETHANTKTSLSFVVHHVLGIFVLFSLVLKSLKRIYEGMSRLWKSTCGRLLPTDATPKIAPNVCYIIRYFFPSHSRRYLFAPTQYDGQ